MRYIKLKLRFNFLFIQFLKLEKEETGGIKTQNNGYLQYSLHFFPFDFFLLPRLKKKFRRQVFIEENYRK